MVRKICRNEGKLVSKQYIRLKYLFLSSFKPGGEGLGFFEVPVNLSNISKGFELFQLFVISFEFLHKPFSS